MSPGKDQIEEHERFRQMCALSVAGNLKGGEAAELRAHLEVCEQCRALHEEYLLVAREGMPMLAVRFDHPQEVKGWDNSNVKSKILEHRTNIEPEEEATPWLKQINLINKPRTASKEKKKKPTMTKKTNS